MVSQKFYGTRVDPGELVSPVNEVWEAALARPPTT